MPVPGPQNLNITNAPSARGVVRSLRPVDAVMFLFYLVLLALGAVADARSPLWFVALALSVACAVLWFIARVQLGLAFSVRPEAHLLVTSGLYSKLRHPIYVFGTMAFMLALLSMQGWSALVIWAILIPIQVMRARREDAVLAEAFGAEYATYRRSTWF
jgi:protein-S-isoprenylcysteine O-methyltransferase Ste14